MIRRSCLLALVICAAPALGATVSYRVQFVGEVGCHVVQVDLNSPWVKVTPITALGFPGGAESMSSICRRQRPTAAVTGTFFSKSTLLPIGDIVRDGRLIYFGGMGSALAITPVNEVVFEDVPWGRHRDWGPFETVLACGPRLLRSGEVALAPVHQGFSDPHVLGRAARTAVGLTPANKLLMVVTRHHVSLWDLAKIMRALGCIDAINLDGGSSIAMYYRGKAVVTPARRLVNMLAVYESVEHEGRTCNCELPAERQAIYIWRAGQAYQAYMKAQTPLAQGDMDTAVRLLAQAADLDPLNASYQVRLAETLARQGDIAGASAAFSRAGQILADKGMPARATEYLQRALQYNPDNPIAQSRLPEVYRARGMEEQAQAAEYNLKMRELQSRITAAHPELVADMISRAWALVGLSLDDSLPQPRLTGLASDDSYLDLELGVRLQLPQGWEFVSGEDPSALLMRHRFRPFLAHLRVMRVPERLDMKWLMELYYERSFLRELNPPPLEPGLKRVTRVTEAVTPDGTVRCDTVFVRSGDLLWILSLTCQADRWAQAAPDLQAIADGFTLLRR
ncbi:MAG: phosphodiester glycosidase family protein [Armatimonadetes bacterium]|nr:phosphodiester glycosidase family protein [Armatimonadota bacterium]